MNKLFDYKFFGVNSGRKYETCDVYFEGSLGSSKRGRSDGAFTESARLEALKESIKTVDELKEQILNEIKELSN